MSLHFKGKVSLDGSGWTAGLTAIEHATEHVTGHLKGMFAAAFGAAAIEEAIRRTMEYAESIGNMAIRIGIGVEALQEFGFAAKMAGANIEDLQNFVEKLNQNRFTKGAAGAWAKMGISEDDRKSLRAEDIMMKLSERARGMSSQELSGPMREIGGRGGDSMVGMLKSDLSEVREEARRLGQVMQADTIAKLKLTAEHMKAVSQVVIISLAPALAVLMDKLLKFSNAVKASITFFETAKLTVHDLLIMTGLSGSSKTERAELSKRLTHAGSASQSQLDELTDQTADQIKALKTRLVAAGIDVPSFEPGEVSSKQGREHAFKTEKDSLIAVGNFLGSGRSAIEDISRQQLFVLQSIDRKLSPGTGGGVDGAGMNMADIPLV